MHGHTHGRTLTRLVYYKLTMSLKKKKKERKKKKKSHENSVLFKNGRQLKMRDGIKAGLPEIKFSAL